MTLLPLGKIEIVATVQRNWVAMEKIGHECEEAIGSELVGDELSVVELVPDDVGETGSHRNVRQHNSTNCGWNIRKLQRTFRQKRRYVQQHGVVGGFILGVRGVNLKTVDGGDAADGLALMLDAFVAARTGTV